MSNPFKQIKQEAHLTQHEKNAMRAKLVLEMGKKTEMTAGQFSMPEQKVKSPFVFSSKYFLSGIVALAALVLVVTNLNNHSMFSSVARLNQFDGGVMPASSSVAMQYSLVSQNDELSNNGMVNKTTGTPTSENSLMMASSSPMADTAGSNQSQGLFTAGGGSSTYAIAPKIIITFKSGNEYLKNYVPVCDTNGQITCYPSKQNLQRMTYLGNSYYLVTFGEAFSNITFTEAAAMNDDNQLSSALIKRGIQKTYEESTKGYECNQVAQSIEELKQLVVNNKVSQCQKLW